MTAIRNQPELTQKTRPRPVRLFQVDAVKGCAILAVLILHTMPPDWPRRSWAAFHVWQAVPMFLIASGFVAGVSVVKRRSLGLQPESYRDYFRKRVVRILIPFVICWAASIGLALIFGRRLGAGVPYLGPLTFIGLLPLTGPGNYFISLVFETALLMPLIMYCFRKTPVISLIACMLLDLGYELASKHVKVLDTVPYLHSACVLRYLFAIGLGVWISVDSELLSRHNVLVLAGSALSLAWIAYFQLTWCQIPGLREDWGWQVLLAYFYPAMIFLVALQLLPNRAPGAPLSILGVFGAASYHVFLVQMLWFAAGWAVIQSIAKRVLPGTETHTAQVVFQFASMPVCLGLGTGWWYLETAVPRWIRGARLGEGIGHS